MKKPPKNIAPIDGQGDKKPHAHFNSLAAQRQRLIARLRADGKIDTIAARRDLDILMPAARVHELRHRYGLEIDLIWVQLPTDCGRVHRVGQYVLRPKMEA